MPDVWDENKIIAALVTEATLFCHIVLYTQDWLVDTDMTEPCHCYCHIEVLPNWYAPLKGVLFHLVVPYLYCALMMIDSQ